MKKMIKLFSLVTAIIMLFLSISLTAFATQSLLVGDADGDGILSAADARIILRISVGIDKAENIETKRLDTDCDGEITASDARTVLRLSIGLAKTGSLQGIPEGAEFAGYTEKGYSIYTVDGLTFIDGILIVNKTYALPSSYNPGALTKECSDAFNRMKSDAASQGLYLYINSAFRTYSYQESLYNRYVSRDGKRLADTYSARPGHSEHQSGLSLDLNTVTQAFANTPEGRWVAAHCHEYGFIIRYPKGKSHITGYCYEPWHLRYVGIEKAAEISQSGLCLEEFYGISSIYS